MEPYKGLNDSDYFGEYFVILAQLHAGATVLDIYFGKGASLFPAITQVGSNGHVTGVASCIRNKINKSTLILFSNGFFIK